MPTTMTVERQQPPAPDVGELELRTKVDQILNRHPAVGLAVGVVRDGRLRLFHGHGLADIATNAPITEDTVLRIASITKTFTAIAVMQLWERGLVDLDAPANDYLRAYKLIPARAGHRAATIRHLLTHTAGLPETLHPWDALRADWGESLKAGAPLPSLAEHYRGRLRLEAEPGTQFVYGNHSPATLGQIVEDVSGEPLAHYVRHHIFEPLGMVDTDFGPSERLRSRLATGYTIGANGPNAVADRDFVTTGAASIYSTPRDMARYVAALLGGGSNGNGAILGPATVASMFEAHYRPDPRISGMGLGFFRSDLDGHLAVGHEGLLPGFDSQILLAPGDGVGMMAFTNGARDASLWLPAWVAALLRELLGVPGDAIRTDVPQHPEVWAEVCGWYRLSAGLNDVRVRGMVGMGAEVFVRDGRLALRFLTPIPAMYRGFPLHPDDSEDPYAYRLDLSESGMGTTRVVFSRTPAAGTTAVHVDLMPVSLRRQPAITNPRLWATRVLPALAVVTAAAVVRGRRRRSAT